jgi:membrane protein
MAINWRNEFVALRTAAIKWNDHNAPRLGASLAFYTLLSLAPLVILMVPICALVFTQAKAEQELIFQAQELAGPSGAATLRALIANSHEPKGGLLAGIEAIIALAFGASGVFVELRDSLNTIWDAPPPKADLKSIIWRRASSFGMVLALGFVLLVSLLLSTVLALIEKLFTNLLPTDAAMFGEVANILVSFLAIAVICGLIFKFIPDVSIEWKTVGIGATVTALLFTLGRTVLGFYLLKTGLGSPYGAAGSIVALIVWVYYSAQIFLFGAQLTRVYADRLGFVPAAHPIVSPKTRSATSQQ